MAGLDFNPEWLLGGYAREGLSSRAALKAFREIGGRSGNQAFRALYDSVRTSLASHSDLMSLPADELAGEQHYRAWQAGQPGRYAQQNVLRVWDPGIGGIVEIEHMTMTDVQLTVNDSITQSIEEYEEGVLDESPRKGQRVMSGYVKGLYKTV